MYSCFMTEVRGCGGDVTLSLFLVFIKKNASPETRPNSRAKTNVKLELRLCKIKE